MEKQNCVSKHPEGKNNSQKKLTAKLYPLFSRVILILMFIAIFALLIDFHFRLEKTLNRVSALEQEIEDSKYKKAKTINLQVSYLKLDCLKKSFEASSSSSSLSPYQAYNILHYFSPSHRCQFFKSFLFLSLFLVILGFNLSS